MSFRFSPGGRGAADPWFRVGTVDVSTTTLVVAIGTISMIIDAFTGRALFSWLAMVPDAVFAGEAWRVVTWPLANTVGIWTALSLFMLWYFGNDLESELGRARMARLLLGFAAVLTVVHLAFGVLDPFRLILAGIDMPQLMVLLAWIAQYPTRRFMFNVPAWVFGLVIVALQALGLIAERGLWALLALLVSLLLCAVVARSVGLLTDADWLPTVKRRPRAPRRTFNRSRPTVVSGPWADHPSAGTATTSGSARTRDSARLDELLDRISAVGMDGLSDKERKELHDLRERRGR